MPQLIIFDMSGTLYDEYTQDVYPELVEIIKAAHAQNKLLAVATNLGRNSTQKFLDKFGIKQYFHTVATADLYGFKPQPDMFEFILEDNGVDAGEAIMIGDSLSDITGAQGVGIATCAVNWHGIIDKEILACHPHFIVSKISDLWHILGLSQQNDTTTIK